MPYKCFLLERTEQVRIDLRRYADGPCPFMPGKYSYHDAVFVNFLTFDYPIPPLGECERYDCEQYRPAKEDPRWPRTCRCGYQFDDSAPWQLFTHRFYRRSDTGEQVVLREAPVGALYYADWIPWKHYWDNMTSPYLYCVTPGGEWCIDSRASNCTMPTDRTHRCWVRHGELPNIHVDKNGYTCAAGAGSIICGNYHGFLHNGYLTDGC